MRLACGPGGPTSEPAGKHHLSQRTRADSSLIPRDRTAFEAGRPSGHEAAPSPLESTACRSVLRTNVLHLLGTTGTPPRFIGAPTYPETSGHCSQPIETLNGLCVQLRSGIVALAHRYLLNCFSIHDSHY